MKLSLRSSGQLGVAQENPAPLVSVVIPTFNCARFLAEAVDSVFRQSYSALECIVIDDGSTDQTNDVLTSLLARYPRLKIIRKTNGGPSSARNAGLRLCSGDFVSFVDADDVLLHDKIARQVEFLNAYPDVDLVYSDYLVVSDDLQPLAIFSAQMPHGLDPVDAFCYRNWFNPLVTLIRRSLIDKVGGFDEELAVAEDWDYWIRCALLGRIAHLAGPVGLYRQHPNQLHRDHVCMRQACTRLAKKHFTGDRNRLRAAMAGIDWKHAKHLWKHGAIAASLGALMKFVLRDRLGLHRGRMREQLAAVIRSQLRRLPLNESGVQGAASKPESLVHTI